MLVGVVVLGALAKSTLQIGAGVAVVAAGLLAARWGLAGAGGSPVRRWWQLGLAAGGAAGFLATTTTSTSGPPIVLYIQRLGLDPEAIRDTVTAAFLAVNLLGAAVVVLLAAADAGSPEPFLVGVLGVTTLAGQRAGRWAFERLDPRTFPGLVWWSCWLPASRAWSRV